MKPFEKIYNYSLIINQEKKEYVVKLKVSNVEEIVELSFNSITELSAIAELLRNEALTFYDINTNEIIIGWEPTGENDPKHKTIY